MYGYKEWKNLSSDVLLITHANCMDGTGTAVSLMKWMELSKITDYEIVYLQHGKNMIVPDVEGKNVIICDFSFKEEILENMNETANSLILLDHHASAMEDLEHLDYCHFDMKKSGAMLMWEHLFVDAPPAFISYVQDRDLWNWLLPDSEEVSSVLRLNGHKNIISNYNDYLDDDFIYDLAKSGSMLTKATEEYVNGKVHIANKDRPVSINGFEVPCINNSHEISKVGNALSENMPFSAQFFITDTEIVFSLRSVEGGEDVSEIAKSHGGGGHPRAAGFSYLLSEFDMKSFFVEKIVKG